MSSIAMENLNPCKKCGKWGVFIIRDGLCSNCFFNDPNREKDFVSSTICFSGHRKINNPHPDLQEKLTTVARRAGYKGFHTALTGGAIGVDWMAHKAVNEAMPLRPRYDYSLYALCVVRPFPSHGSNWPANVQEYYRKHILEMSASVIDVNPDPYAPWKLFKRDEWMIDSSAVLVTVWDGRRQGGTYTGINYALRNNRFVLWINPWTLEEQWLDAAVFNSTM